jgi:hypothetical protein
MLFLESNLFILLGFLGVGFELLDSKYSIALGLD